MQLSLNSVNNRSGYGLFGRTEGHIFRREHTVNLLNTLQKVTAGLTFGKWAVDALTRFMWFCLSRSFS